MVGGQPHDNRLVGCADKDFGCVNFTPSRIEFRAPHCMYSGPVHDDNLLLHWYRHSGTAGASHRALGKNHKADSPRVHCPEPRAGARVTLRFTRVFRPPYFFLPAQQTTDFRQGCFGRGIGAISILHRAGPPANPRSTRCASSSQCRQNPSPPTARCPREWIPRTQPWPVYPARWWNPAKKQRQTR